MKMSCRSAITKLHAIFIIDLLVVAFAVGGYLYIGTLARAQFEVTDMMITPEKAGLNEPINIFTIVTNIGEKAGNYSVDLKIDGVVEETRTVELSPGASTQVTFTVFQKEYGHCSVEIGDLIGTFEISPPPPPKPTEFKVSDLVINPTEVGIDKSVTISVKVTNIGEEVGSYSVDLKINGGVEGTETVELLGGTSTTMVFTVAKREHGNYSVEIDSLAGTFEVTAVPPPPKPAEFKVTNLVITPTEVGVDEPVTVSVTVTNVGEEVGSYSVDLKINGTVEESKTDELLAGVSTDVTFVVTKGEYRTYYVEIDDLADTFACVHPTPSPPTREEDIRLSFLVIQPAEAWVNDPVNISVYAQNWGNGLGSLSVNLTINGHVQETKTVQLPAGEGARVEFTSVSEASQGTYFVQVKPVAGTFMKKALSGNFTVVPTGFHTLIVTAGPVSGNAVADGVELLLEGKSYILPYSALLPVGYYKIEVPLRDPTLVYIFCNWDTGSAIPERLIHLDRQVVATAYYSGNGSSCPSLYIWNGTSYVYVAEVSNHGWLGYINYISGDGSIVFYRNDPWDYIPLDKSQLQPDNGYYNMTLIQRWDEIFYLDSAHMLVVDHPSDVNVYSTMVEQYLDPDYVGQIYTVSKNPLTPISVVNENGEDTLPQISKIDGVFTTGLNGLSSPSWNNITWNRLTLNLGDLSNADQIKLVVKAIVDWGSPEDYTIWLDGFLAQPVPNSTQVTPPPYMEVKDANGNWIRVSDSRQFPLPPDGVPRTFVVDLTGLFPTNDYSLRISNFWNVTFDYIGIDTSSQQNVTIRRIYPYATLYQEFNTTSVSAGNFTGYGDVTQLVLNADDNFVIGRQGDAVSLQFPALTTPPQAKMERDYFFFDALWFKDKNGNWGFGFGFTVDPLPFQDMSGFPYPLTESYPYDANHLSYLSKYNTRTIIIP